MNTRILQGGFFALCAGIVWGLVFAGPLVLPEYPASLLSFGRYLAFGMIALPLALFDRAGLARLRRDDWIEALKLAAIGNIVYYLFLAGAIQYAGGALPSMLLGTLPVVIALASRADRTDAAALPWSRLLPSLGLIALGIALVNQSEMATVSAAADMRRYAIGGGLALAAVVCWTWYPIRNARWLRDHPDHHPRTWATAQGLATLPLALVGYAGNWLYASGFDPAFPMPLGPQPGRFLVVMFAIGLLASWLGGVCWNAASKRLPTGVAGQLIVFETLAALSYVHLLRGQWPRGAMLAGGMLLVLGVVLAVWSPRTRQTVPA
ncbi:DMT family transporter [Tahibacter amnicola]|uniref:DMT family transporter n=1 Tax=Tahibacter amnicola TaxID=2976241 RepID=A0ABY6BLQ4_9GAMM|nr:DMT family transporter [Tahibacter amnicola]UXI70378.1 DMT family transporter [Tahibacter amnicola]